MPDDRKARIDWVRELECQTAEAKAAAYLVTTELAAIVNGFAWGNAREP